MLLISLLNLLKYLTYLLGQYNLLQVLASANLRRHTSRALAAWRQFRIPRVLRFSLTCLAQSWGGRSCLRHPPPGSDLKTLRTGFVIHTNWVRNPYELHRRRCILIRLTTSMSSYISYSSWFRCRRKIHKSYVGFSYRKPAACSSEDEGIPAKYQIK